MGEPPLDVGAVQETVMTPLVPPVATTFVGAPGTVWENAPVNIPNRSRTLRELNFDFDVMPINLVVHRGSRSRILIRDGFFIGWLT